MALIEKNQGKPFTNAQFQAEQPAYYEWFLAKEALQCILRNRTGIDKGVLEALMMSARKPLLKGSKMQIPPVISDRGNLVDRLHLKALGDADVVVQEHALKIELPESQ